MEDGPCADDHSVRSVELGDTRASRYVPGGVDSRVEPPARGLFRSWLGRQLASPYVYLVPLRLFIGFGWLRATAEKLTDSTWYTGEAIRGFLDMHVADGTVVFTSYEWMIENIWYPTAQPLGWVVMAIQLTIGLAIFCGAYTNAALLAGIVLNVNFMLAGSINPSAFYIVIQVALLAVGVGAVFGFDDGLQADWKSILVTAKTTGVASTRRDRRVVLGLAMTFLLAGSMAISRATDFTPGGIEDPALVLAAVLFVSAMIMLLAIAREFAIGRNSADVVVRIR